MCCCLCLQILHHIVVKIFPVTGAFLFVFTHFDEKFLHKLQELRRTTVPPRKTFLKHTAGAVLLLSVFLMLEIDITFYKSGHAIPSKKLKTFLVAKYGSFTENEMILFVLVVCIRVTLIWLQTLMNVTVLLAVSAIVTCKCCLSSLCHSLRNNIVSGDIYKPDVFSFWNIDFQKKVQLINDLNNHIHLYVGFLVFVYSFSIMGVIYNIGVLCEEWYEAANYAWLLNAAIPLFYLMFSAVRYQNQVHEKKQRFTRHSN